MTSDRPRHGSRHPRHHLRRGRAGLQALAYIGTDNKDFGTALGKQLLQLKPEGGNYAMISGGPAPEPRRSASMACAKPSRVRPGSKCRLADLLQRRLALAVQQMARPKTATPDLGAIVPVGGWPMFAPEGYKAFVNKIKADIDAGT